MKTHLPRWSRLLLFLLLAMGLRSIPARAAGSVVMNEIMAANAGTVTSPQGEYADWVELYNGRTTPVDVGGMYLTDDADTPLQWRIPTDSPGETVIEAGGFLILWLDGRTTADAGLHAPFRLSITGETLVLYDVDGVTAVDRVTFGRQRPDTSYGRLPDGAPGWQRIGSPTPGAVNEELFAGFVADTSFSVDRGFFAEAFALEIATATAGAEIRYTLDGSEPGPDQGSVYTGPIPIGRTTCVRAMAHRPGWVATNVDTQTYLFLDDAIHQPRQPAGFPSKWKSVTADYEMDPEVIEDPRYRDRMEEALRSLPSLSLVMDQDDLFGSQGIYVNPTADGVAWERPGSIELIDPNGDEAFQTNCGVRIQGGYFRALSHSTKNSFRLLFKTLYGDSKLRYPLFGDSAVTEFDTVVLRAGANDGYAWNGARYTEQYTRDEFGRSLQVATGNAGAHGRFVHLYVNGLYWGLYNLCERPDAAFAASTYGNEKENWDSLHDLTARSGDTVAWNQMLAVCREAATSDEAFQKLQGNNPDGTPNPAYPHLLDVPNYIDYLIVNLWGGNWDWPWKNWWAARERSTASTGFKFFCWDYENTLGNNLGRSPLSKNSLHNNFSSAGMPHASLKQNAEYRLLFADRVQRLFFNDGPLTPASLIARYARLADTVEDAIITESARWGDMHFSTPLTQEDWYDHGTNYQDGRAGRDWILDYYLPQRSDIVLQQLRSAGLYPEVAAPVFQVEGQLQHGGHIATTDRVALVGEGTIWYTLDGTDPRLAEAGPPTDIVYLVSEAAPKRVLIPTGPVPDAWRGAADFDDTTWIPGTGGVGYEHGSGYESAIDLDVSAMYQTQTSCLIRIPFDLERVSGLAVLLSVRYDDGFVAYLNGVEIARRNAEGQPTWNAAASAQHDDSAALQFENMGVADGLALLRPGRNILAIHGLNVGTSSSDFLIAAQLTLYDPPTDTQPPAVGPGAHRYAGPLTLDHSTTVRARAQSNGQWSALNEAVFAVGPVAETLRITEIMYHPEAPDLEYLELTNIGTETLRLDGVRFTDGIEFAFADQRLRPGESLVLVQDLAAFTAAYGPGLPVAGAYQGSLSNGSERIELQDAAGQSIQRFTYHDDWHPSTDGKGYSLTIIDPAADPATWNNADAWTPSPQPGGSPGTP